MSFFQYIGGKIKPADVNQLTLLQISTGPYVYRMDSKLTPPVYFAGSDVGLTQFMFETGRVTQPFAQFVAIYETFLCSHDVFIADLMQVKWYDFMVKVGDVQKFRPEHIEAPMTKVSSDDRVTKPFDDQSKTFNNSLK